MAIEARYDVWCDAAGCSQWIGDCVTRKLAAANACACGWKYIRGEGWRCPQCLREHKLPKRKAEPTLIMRRKAKGL